MGGTASSPADQPRLKSSTGTKNQHPGYSGLEAVSGDYSEEFLKRPKGRNEQLFTKSISSFAQEERYDPNIGAGKVASFQDERNPASDNLDAFPYEPEERFDSEYEASQFLAPASWSYSTKQQSTKGGQSQRSGSAPASGRQAAATGFVPSAPRQPSERTRSKGTTLASSASQPPVSSQQQSSTRSGIPSGTTEQPASTSFSHSVGIAAVPVVVSVPFQQPLGGSVHQQQPLASGKPAAAPASFRSRSSEVKRVEQASSYTSEQKNAKLSVTESSEKAGTPAPRSRSSGTTSSTPAPAIVPSAQPQRSVVQVAGEPAGPSSAKPAAPASFRTSLIAGGGTSTTAAQVEQQDNKMNSDGAFLTDEDAYARMLNARQSNPDAPQSLVRAPSARSRGSKSKTSVGMNNVGFAQDQLSMSQMEAFNEEDAYALMLNSRQSDPGEAPQSAVHSVQNVGAPQSNAGRASKNKASKKQATIASEFAPQDPSSAGAVPPSAAFPLSNKTNKQSVFFSAKNEATLSMWADNPPSLNQLGPGGQAVALTSEEVDAMMQSAREENSKSMFYSRVPAPVSMKGKNQDQPGSADYNAAAAVPVPMSKNSVGLGGPGSVTSQIKGAAAMPSSGGFRGVSTKPTSQAPTSGKGTKSLRSGNKMPNLIPDDATNLQNMGFDEASKHDSFDQNSYLSMQGAFARADSKQSNKGGKNMATKAGPSSTKSNVSNPAYTTQKQTRFMSDSSLESARLIPAGAATGGLSSGGPGSVIGAPIMSSYGYLGMPVNRNSRGMPTLTPGGGYPGGMMTYSYQGQRRIGARDDEVPELCCDCCAFFCETRADRREVRRLQRHGTMESAYAEPTSEHTGMWHSQFFNAQAADLKELRRLEEYGVMMSRVYEGEDYNEFNRYHNSCYRCILVAPWPMIVQLICCFVVAIAVQIRMGQMGKPDYGFCGWDFAEYN
ncbi:unnamed protein product [Amoebophrya sp. A120]|nr:unnamed protein product [Amoebophrya sp. A120]|eukprot:GSA120T00003159001.1